MLTHEENPQASSESIPVENHVTDEGEVRLAPRNRQDTSELPSVRTSFFERAAASQEKRPRLVISKMVLHNFKSYAGTVEIGPFHKSFTSIVGPNGSGKSNVIDSLLFVFGFKAKKMRQGKLSDLIHHSNAFPDLTSCHVQVHFQEIVDRDDPDEYDAVPNSEIIVTRIVEKLDGEKRGEKSIYQLNNKTSSYSEVTKLLKEKGVDLDHKRFLILQGEVESIALMKPKATTEHEDGLLEYLEDIIGTNVYKTHIEDATKELESVSVEREEKLNRLKIVRKDVTSLESLKEEAIGFIETENQITRLKNKLYQRNMWYAQTQCEELSRNMVDLKASLEEKKESLKSFTDEVGELETTLAAKEKNMKGLQAKLDASKAELQKYDRAEVELKERERHLSQKRKKLEKAIQQETHTRSEDQTWISNFDHDLKKAESEKQELEERLGKEESELDKIRESLRGKTEGLQRQVEAKQAELAPWNEKISAKNVEMEVAQSEFNLLNEAIENQRTAVKQAEQHFEELQEHYKAKKEEFITLDKKREKCLSTKKSIETEVETLKKGYESFKDALKAARQKTEEARSSASAAKTRGNMYMGLQRQSQSGAIKGICGRLGDLGIIDDKYDVAVTTACGALDSIVVESVETGQACIEYLKKQNLGRATFICLDKMKQKDMSSIKTPENVHRLFDLIQPKESRFGPAFYHALGDTLVANDLKQANRIAFGKERRFRVVTVDGQLIDVSGTMSGGGTKPQRGGMSSRFSNMDEASPAQLTQLEKEEERAENELERQAALLSAKKDEIKKLVSELASLDRSIQKAELDIKSTEQKIGDAEIQVRETKESSAPDPESLKRMKQLSGLIQKLEGEMNQFQTLSSKLEAELNQLQEQILEIGGVKLRAQKARVDSITDQIQSLSEKVTKLQVERGMKERNLVKLEKTIAKKTTELEEVETELKGLKDEGENASVQASALRGEVQKTEYELMDLEEAMKESRSSLEEKSATLNKLKSAQVEIKAQLSEVTQAHTQNTRTAESFRLHLETLSLQETGFEEDQEMEGLPSFSVEELAELNEPSLRKEVEHLEAELKKMMPNLSVLEEYKRKMQVYLTRASDLDAITAKRDQVKEKLDAIKKRRFDEFMAGFNAISLKLKEMYQMITMGGNAELELVDSLDPFSEGIIFSVMPPKKSWKNIANLSGGEKTLSSLALVFALHHFKPTPLYVMDEIDAALDFRNVSIVANYIKQRTKNAQFVIISLRNNMFELADRLVGIYKTDNRSKSVTISPKTIAMTHSVPL